MAIEFDLLANMQSWYSITEQRHRCTPRDTSEATKSQMLSTAPSVPKQVNYVFDVTTNLVYGVVIRKVVRKILKIAECTQHSNKNNPFPLIIIVEF